MLRIRHIILSRIFTKNVVLKFNQHFSKEVFQNTLLPHSRHLPCDEISALSSSTHVNKDDPEGEIKFGTLANEWLSEKKIKRKLKLRKIRTQISRAQNAAVNFNLLEEESDQTEEKFGKLANQEELLSVTRDLMSTKEAIENIELDATDNHIRLSRFGRKHDIDWYHHRIKKLCDSGKLTDATQVILCDMLKEDRVLPKTFTFNLLMSPLARAGHANSCFELAKKMSQMSIKPNMATYCMVLSSCANHSDPKSLRSHILGYYDKLCVLNEDVCLFQHLDKNFKPMTLPVHNALICALGRAGLTREAFRALDELVTTWKLHQTLSKSVRRTLNLGSLKPDEYTLSAVLETCKSDKESGTGTALVLWHRLKELGVKPNGRSYAALLSVVQACGIGTAENLFRLLQLDKQGKHHHHHHQQRLLTVSSSDEQQRLLTVSSSDEQQQLLTVSSSDEQQRLLTVSSSDEQQQLLTVSSSDEQQRLFTVEHLPKSGLLSVNLLLKLPTNLDECNHLCAAFSDKADRLELLGGLQGIQHSMQRDNVRLHLKHLGQLASMLYGAPRAKRDEILLAASAASIRPDLPLYNMLLRGRIDMGENVDDLLESMTKDGLSPDIVTFGCLAVGCKTESQAVRLLGDIRNARMLPSVRVYNCLVRAAGFNFKYQQELLRNMYKDQVVPTSKILQSIDKLVTKFESFTRENSVLTKAASSQSSFSTSKENISRGMRNYIMAGWNQCAFKMFQSEYLNLRKSAQKTYSKQVTDPVKLLRAKENSESKNMTLDLHDRLKFVKWKK